MNDAEKISPKKASPAGPQKKRGSQRLQIAQKSAPLERDGAAVPSFVMNGVGMITAERARQIEKEGWSAEHDDSHGSGEMAAAAASYATMARARESGPWGMWTPDLLAQNAAKVWPWDDLWFKPRDSVSDLVRAGALIAAEIDRLLRKKVRETGKCPQCNEAAVFPRDLDPYCEECGWPEENWPEHTEGDGGGQ